MNRFGKTMIAAAAVLGAGASAVRADTNEVPSAAEFAPIQRYAIAYDEPRDLARFYLREAGFFKYDGEIEVLTDPADTDRRVMLVTVEPLADAKVKGVQYRFAIRSVARRWQAEDAGMRRKCQSGTDADRWTTDTCP